ncbi:response regulator [Deinococcus aquaedulcis]|uniref:response regulator n=1 Tax=Deinococcus aquaedulcis TaxID=2840455 RepID=UPI001C828833|nr:response regulator [Deinococcus aquaedulcis]
MTAAAAGSPSILIVDDSPGLLQTMSAMLRPHLPVTLADSGRAALDSVTADTALVLTDVRMPGMSGIELAEQLRRRHPKLPVMFMTGVVEEELRAQAKALGVCEVLRKPLRAERLLPTLKGWLGSEAFQADQTPAAPAPAPAAPPAVDEAAERLKLAEDASSLLAGLGVLPGVSAAAVLDGRGALLGTTTSVSAEILAYVRFLFNGARTLSPHLAQPGPLRAVHVEFQEQVLVLCPVPGGLSAILVRDTPTASSVKAWLRQRLN